MGKAKMFGGISVAAGLLMGLIAYVMVPGSFLKFLTTIYLPVLLVTIGLVALIIGILLLVYG
jgi:hypothetical protein